MRICHRDVSDGRESAKEVREGEERARSWVEVEGCPEVQLTNTAYCHVLYTASKQYTSNYSTSDLTVELNLLTKRLLMISTLPPTPPINIVIIRETTHLYGYQTTPPSPSKRRPTPLPVERDFVIN